VKEVFLVCKDLEDYPDILDLKDHQDNVENPVKQGETDRLDLKAHGEFKDYLDTLEHLVYPVFLDNLVLLVPLVPQDVMEQRENMVQLDLPVFLVDLVSLETLV